MYAHDYERPLSARGQREQAQIAALLAPLLSPLDDVLSSPLLRARQTADLTVAALQDAPAIVETAALGEHSTVSGVIALLAQYPPPARLLCVGHEPSMSRLAAAFLDVAGHGVIDFQRSAILGLHFSGHPAPGRGTLRLFLHPEDMLLLAPPLPGAGRTAPG